MRGAREAGEYRRVPRGEREGKVRAASRDLAAKTNETRSELNPKVERDEEMKEGGGGSLRRTAAAVLMKGGSWNVTKSRSGRQEAAR